MTKLFAIFFVCSGVVVVNCKFKKNLLVNEKPVFTTLSFYQIYKNIFQSVGTSFKSKNDGVTPFELNDTHSRVEETDSFNEIYPNNITIESYSRPHPCPFPPGPQPQPFSPPLPPAPICPSEETQTIDSQTLVWPDTDKDLEAISTPLCLDENFKIMKRKCEDTWAAAPECKRVQHTITNPCPPDLTPIADKYCYKIIEKTTYPPQCPYPEIVEWHESVQLSLTTDPIWMPVIREVTDNYGSDVFRITELGESYKLPYEICTQSCRTFFYSGSFLDKYCQIYHNNTHIEAVACDQHYSAVCVYHALPKKTRSFCNQVYSANNCRQSGYDTNSYCFCEAPNNNQVGRPAFAEFLLPYQNLIYTNLDKTCHIGLEQSEESLPSLFHWSASNLPINYSNWAPEDVNFDNMFGVITANGWILASDKDKDCVLYQIPAPTNIGMLQLHIDESEEKLFKLTIKNYTSFLSNDNNEPIVYCFTDADAINLLYRLDNFSKTINVVNENEYIYKFSDLKIPQSGPGNYWCEAFLYPNLNVITSDIKTLTNYEAEYVVILKLKQYEEKLSSYPLRAENFATLQNLFKNELVNPMSFFPRIIKLNDVDEDKKELTITFHLSSSKATNTDDLFNTLKAASMAQNIFEFVDFRSVDFCPSIKTRQIDGQFITWPHANLGDKMDPVNGFCVTENVTFIKKSCLGNFIDGAYWSEITDNCTFYDSSILTENLITITNCTDSCDSALNDILAITEQYNSYKTLDLVLTVKYLKTIADHKPDLKIFAEIINNIMKISRASLLSSQLNFKATDSLLLSLDKALEDGDFTEHTTDNFAITSINCKNNGIYGIFLQNCAVSFTDCKLVPITDTSLLNNETYISTNEVVAAIALSTKLYDQINKYSEVNSSYIPKLIVSIYYGSQLFIELNVQKFSNYVFGVLFPGFTEEFKGPLSIYYYNNSKNNYLGYNCSYWDFDDSSFSSWADEGTENFNQAVYCEFYHVTNFGIPSILSDEYCEANEDFENNLESSDCLVKSLNNVDNPKKSLVKYQKLCEYETETDPKYEEDYELFGDTFPCTIFVTDSNSTDLSQFCYIGNATAIPTECFENFNVQAHSFNITENCVKYWYSNLLGDVYEFCANCAQAGCSGLILDVVFLYSENYSNFSDLDILVVAAVLNPIYHSNPNLQIVAGIVNNLMKIPNSILNSAQRSFRANDILLDHIEEILKDGDCSEWKTENFVIKCLDISNEIVGLVIKNCSTDFNDCSLSPILLGDNIYNGSYHDFDQIQASIYLTDLLYNQIISYSFINSSYKPKMIVSLYSGSQLFVELNDSASKKDVFSFIFGILIPDFNEKFVSPILIQYFNNVTSENVVDYNCSYWKYDSTSYGSWMTENNTLNISKEVAICEFYHVTNFAMTMTILNYSQSINVDHNQLSEETTNHYICDQKHNIPINSVFFKERDYTCAPRKKQVTINNFFVNNLGKIDVFGQKFFSFYTIDDRLTFLGPDVPTVSNKKFTTQLTKNSMFNQSINVINLRSTSFSKYINYETQYLKTFDNECKNITHELEKVTKQLNSNHLDSIFLILEQIMLKNSFIDLTENHIKAIARTLREVVLSKNVNILKKVIYIVNIMMKVPKDTMIAAQAKFKTGDKILYIIDNALEDFETTIQIQKENIIFLIISKDDVSNFYGVCVTKNKNVLNIKKSDKEENKLDESEVDICIILSSQLHDQIKTSRTRMIFVIFYSDVYFSDKNKDRVVKPIVEVLFPDLKEHLKADFKISYRFDNDSDKFSKCSYWDHIVTTNKVIKTGSWRNELSPQINGSWVTCTFNHATHFALVTSSPNITTDLEYILNSNLTGLEKLKQVDSITYKSHSSLLPVDIFLISQIIGNSLTEGAVAKITSEIISNLFNVPHPVLRESQIVHAATDIILHNVDKMATMLDDAFINNDNFSLIVKDLNTVNLTGVLLHNCSESKCTIAQLNGVINVSDYSNDNDMSALVIFSQELLAQIKNLTVNTKVIISIYYSNVLFNEINKERNTTKVFGVVFPGLNTSLDGKVSVIYNVGKNINDVPQCAYWYYKVGSEDNVTNASSGKWKNDTAINRQGQVAICNFSHVTHFAMLLSNNDNYNDNAILNIITYIGCILSLLGIVIILLTAIFFKKWRQNTGNKILINFSIAISLKIAMLYISENVKNTSSSIACTISGATLHYAILSECAWMLTIAILQFKRFVEVLGGPPKYVLVKALICGWLFPILPVVCVILIDPDNYIAGNAGLCYPSNLGLYLGIWLPVAIIVSINCVIFIFIIYNVFHKKTEYIDNANYDILFQWRLALLLFFMLGLTWLFGFLGEIKGDELFTYVFSITASMQGFVLFLFFIVFNKSTRVLYSHSAKQWFFSKRIFKLWQTKSQNKY